MPARDQIRTECESAGPDRTKNLNLGRKEANGTNPKNFSGDFNPHRSSPTILLPLFLAEYTSRHKTLNWVSDRPYVATDRELFEPKLLPHRVDSDNLSVFSLVRGLVTLSELHALSISIAPVSTTIRVSLRPRTPQVSSRPCWKDCQTQSPTCSSCTNAVQTVFGNYVGLCFSGAATGPLVLRGGMRSKQKL
jgi:hypothetical protein